MKKINRYIETCNGNKYLTLVLTDENKYIWKTYEELYSKIRDQIRTVSNNASNYNEKYMPIKFDSEDNLPLKKTLVLCNMVIANKYIFHEGNKQILSISFY